MQHSPSTNILWFFLLSFCTTAVCSDIDALNRKFEAELDEHDRQRQRDYDALTNRHSHLKSDQFKRGFTGDDRDINRMICADEERIERKHRENCEATRRRWAQQRENLERLEALQDRYGRDRNGNKGEKNTLRNFSLILLALSSPPLFYLGHRIAQAKKHFDITVEKALPPGMTGSMMLEVLKEKDITQLNKNAMSIQLANTYHTAPEAMAALLNEYLALRSREKAGEFLALPFLLGTGGILLWYYRK